MPPKGVVFDVVGLDYRVTHANQKILAAQVEYKPLNCELHREPQNLNDKNAIAVYTNDDRVIPYFTEAMYHIGYIRRATAAVIAAGMDVGRVRVKSCRLEYVNSDHGWGRVRVAFLKTPASKRRA